MRILRVLALAGLVTATAPALSQTFSATLLGSSEVPGPGDTDGAGVASVKIEGTTISYSILTSGIASPTMAHIHRGVAGQAGDAVVNFDPTWIAGSATGSVTATSELATEIASNPSGFYVNVHNAEFAGGAIRGQLALASGGGTEAVFSTVVKAPGLNGTFFVSDVSIFNPGASTASVALQFFMAGADTKTAPDIARMVVVPAGEQVTILDLLGTTFGTEGSGAVKVISEQPIRIQHRVLNDRSGEGLGSTLLNVPSLPAQSALGSGILLQLSQASAADQAAGTGFRTNVGFFNGGSTTVSATFTAHAPSGAVLGTRTIDVPAGSRQQFSAFGLITDVSDPVQPDFYVTFTTTGGGLFVYSTVVDNKTGDGLYANALPN